MKHNKLYKITVAAIFILLSLVITILYTPNGNFNLLDSYDLLFHLQRMTDISNVFKSPVNFKFWGQIGNMTTIFYPWLTLSPGYFIVKLIGNPIIGFSVWLFIVNILTFVASYFSMKSFSKDRLQSLVFSVLYTFATFRLISIFYRIGVGEYISLIFYPIIFLMFYRIANKEYRYWPFFALSVAAVIYTHVLSTVMLLGILVLATILVLIFNLKLGKQYIYNFLKALLKAAILAIGLTAVFVGPMVQQMLYQKISKPEIFIVQNFSHPVSDILKNAFSLNFAAYNIGPILVFSLLLIIIFIWKDSKVYKITGIITVFTIIFASNIIPWYKFQNTPLVMIQFPWRIFDFYIFFAAIYMSYIVTKIKNINLKKIFATFLIGASILIGLIGIQEVQQRSTLVKDYPVLTMKNYDKAVYNYQSADYYPKEALDYRKDLKKHVFIINNKKSRLAYSVTENSYTTVIKINKKSKVDIPVLRFKGVHVYDNNKIIETSKTKRGTIGMDLSKGTHKIKVQYRYTKLAKISLIVSLIFGLLLIVLVIKFFKKGIKKVGNLK